MYVEASDETMKKRLLKRGESSGRVDDNEETIAKRLDTFHKCTQPVIDYYDKAGKLAKVDSEKDPNDVFADIQKIFEGENGITPAPTASSKNKSPTSNQKNAKLS